MESKFNQFSTIDLSNTIVIRNYIDILLNLENSMKNLEITSDTFKRFSTLFDTVFEKLSKEIESQKNKKVVIDMAILPKEISLDKWQEYFDKQNILFINTSEDKHKSV
jgi:hypothetical protein